MDWDEQILFTCLQGLVNRIEPRLYLVSDPSDERWLSYYRDTFRVQYAPISEPWSLVSRFKDELEGYVIYDSRRLDTVNIAQAIGGLENVLPVSPALSDRLRTMGMRRTDDLRGRWSDRYEAYTWALEHVQPACHPRILGSMCVERPRWPSNMVHVRDYLIATDAFTFDLSTAPPDRRDLALFDQILGAAEAPGVVMGWHCCRDREMDAVARAAQHGFFVLCNLRSPNLTVHAGIRAETHYRQKHELRDLPLEDRIYVAFVLSDGDAIWDMINFQNGNWLKPERGDFPFSWEMQPLMLHLGPGMLRYYYDTMSANDYFVAGPSGAGYTYPSRQPDPVGYLRFSRHYMDRCDLRAIWIMNQHPAEYHREVDDPVFARQLREVFPEGAGFVRGYVEGAFEEHFLGDGPPYLHTMLHLAPDTDIEPALRTLAKGHGQGPLFLAVHVREQVDMGDVQRAMDRLYPEGFTPVALDDFMHLLKKAIEAGISRTQLFPHRGALQAQLIEAGEKNWPTVHGRIQEYKKLLSLPDEELWHALHEGSGRFHPDPLPDVLAYRIVTDMLDLVKAALNREGLYVNHKARSVVDFVNRYSHLPQIECIREVYALWQNWEQGCPGLEILKRHMAALVTLAKALDNDMTS
jgi:hypothetical protein